MNMKKSPFQTTRPLGVDSAPVACAAASKTIAVFCPVDLVFRDKVFSWLDQVAESEVCEEYSAACEVPPRDGSCDFNKHMPNFTHGKIRRTSYIKNKELAAEVDERLGNKWEQLIGSRQPMANCVR